VVLTFQLSSLLLENLPRPLKRIRLFRRFIRPQPHNPREAKRVAAFMTIGLHHVVERHFQHNIPPSVSERILRDVKDRLHNHFRIDQTTIQFEHVQCEVAHGCVIPVGESEEHQHHGH
jgi:hypothetical protein